MQNHCEAIKLIRSCCFSVRCSGAFPSAYAEPFYLICFSFSCFHNSKFRIILFRTPLATWIIFFDLLIFAVGIMPDIFSDFIESCHSPLDYVKGINTMVLCQDLVQVKMRNLGPMSRFSTS